VKRLSAAVEDGEEDEGLEAVDVPSPRTEGTAVGSTERSSRTKVNLDALGNGNDGDRIDRNGSITMELKDMGFGEEAASEAAAQNQTLEGAVAWLLKHSSEALRDVEMRPGGHRKLEEAVGAADGESAVSAMRCVNSTDDLGSVDFPLESHKQVDSSRQGKPRDFAGTGGYSMSTRSSVAPPGASIVEQLLYLGFEQGQCETAAKQNLTLEAAVEWLSSQRATVQL